MMVHGVYTDIDWKIKYDHYWDPLTAKCWDEQQSTTARNDTMHVYYAIGQ